MPKTADESINKLSLELVERIADNPRAELDKNFYACLGSVIITGRRLDSKEKIESLSLNFINDDCEFSGGITFNWPNFVTSGLLKAIGHQPDIYMSTVVGQTAGNPKDGAFKCGSPCKRWRATVDGTVNNCPHKL